MPTALGPLHPEPVRSLPDITLESRYLQAGCINFLRKKDDIDERLGGGVIANGCFDHPVVILSTDLQGKTATVLILTSFGGRDLKERHPENYHVRSLYLPIFPSAAHPGNNIRLFLDNNIRLDKNSYINTQPTHTVHFTFLKKYDGPSGRYKLKSDSYSTLVTYINFTPPTIPSYTAVSSWASPSSAAFGRPQNHTPIQIPETQIYTSARSRWIPNPLTPASSYRIPPIFEESRMDAGYRARYNQDEPQRPYRPLPNITSLPPPEPGFSVSAFIFILSIIFAGFGVVGYMVFFLGRCTWNGITGMRKKLSFIGHLVHELLRKKMPV